MAPAMPSKVILTRTNRRPANDQGWSQTMPVVTKTNDVAAVCSQRVVDGTSSPAVSGWSAGHFSAIQLTIPLVFSPA